MPSCTHCQQPGSKDAEYQLLQKLLPEGYNHLVCTYEESGEGQFRAQIKLRITSEDEVHKWLKDFETSSQVTWRISKTYPNTKSQKNAFRVDLRCQRNTYPKQTGLRKNKTKNTFCRATMFLVLKRIICSKGRKSRSLDPHMKDGYQFHISLRHEHNHRLFSAAALQTRAVSAETIDKLKLLFESGHSPSSALDTLKYDLLEQEGDNYLYAAADRSICPDLPFCFSLYYTIFKNALDPASANNTASAVSASDSAYAASQEESMYEDPSTSRSNTSGTSCGEDLEASVQLFASSITKKLKDDPQTFTAPIRAFLETYNKMNDSSIVSSMHCFGKVPQVKARYLQSLKMIGVQPPATDRRKAALGKRRALLPGRPAKASRKEHHDSKENLRKKSAPHSVAKCVEDNTCLGGHH